MKPAFSDIPQDRESRAQRIRASFRPGTTVPAHTVWCQVNDYWTDAELAGKALSKCQDEVRDALGALLEDGMPFAGPMAPVRNDEEAEETNGKSYGRSRAPKWRQRELWTHDDYEWNIHAYLKRGSQNVQVANRLIVEDCDRYRTVPAHWDIRSTDDAYFDKL